MKAQKEFKFVLACAMAMCMAGCTLIVISTKVHADDLRVHVETPGHTEIPPVSMATQAPAALPAQPFAQDALAEPAQCVSVAPGAPRFGLIPLVSVVIAGLAITTALIFP